MSEITHKTLRAMIQEELDLKVKFTDMEQAYALLALLTAQLPPRTSREKGKSKAAPPKEVADEAPAAPKAADKPKVKKAKVVSAAEAELLAPADIDVAADADAPTLGATDEFRGNKYRLQTLNPTLCVGRRYDEKNPIVGTRTEDEGANGILYPELQCTKKPVAGCRLCTVCTKNEAELKENPSKPPKRWYGRLDEPVYATARVVGSEWFLSKYPSGIEGARPTSTAKAEKPKKVKKDKAPTPPAEAESEPEAAPPIKAEKPKKVKKDKAAPPPPAEEESEPEAEPAPAPKAAPKPVTVAKKASVAAAGAPKNVEWVTFLADGVLLIRHTKTGNVYQCDRSKHRLEDMVQRDKYEGKWRDGRLDPYADEEDE